MGARVKLLANVRGPHNARRYKAGAEFTIYHLIVDGGDITVWLSRPDQEVPAFALSVWLHEIEFLPPEK